MSDRIGHYFLGTASLCLIAGVFMGMWMGTHHDFSLAPIHAHLNLLGWASLAIFGIAYRAFPELAESRIALWHFALSAPAGMLFPLSLYLAIIQGMPALTRIAAPMWFFGAILFAANVWRVALARRSSTNGRRSPAATQGV